MSSHSAHTRVVPWFGMIALLLFAALLAGVTNACFHPRPLPWTQSWADQNARKAEASGFPVVTVEEAQRIVESGSHYLFDARNIDEYDAGHLPMSMSLPLRDFDQAFGQWHAVLRPEDPILVYCGSRDCDDSIVLAARLKDVGMTNVVVLVEGFAGWQAAGLPVE